MDTSIVFELVFIRKVAEMFYMKKSINQSTSFYKSTSLKNRSTSKLVLPHVHTFLIYQRRFHVLPKKVAKRRVSSPAPLIFTAEFVINIGG
jgi:hypothetical protein